MAFKIRRGTNAERLTITPAQGELIFTTDNKKLYIGDGTTVGGVAVDQGLATTTYVDNAITNLIDGAGATLNTLKELADALGSDPNFASNLATTLSNKADLTIVQALDLAKADAASLSTVATSGDYNDLLNKPSIPSVAGLASETFVNNAISNLVGGATSTLDTLNELANALNNDQNFATTITNNLANKADISSLSTVATSGDYADLINVPFTPNLENVGTNILPSTDVTYDLGNPTKRWRDLYLSNSTIYLGETALSVDPVKGLQVKAEGGGEGFGSTYVEWLDTPILRFGEVDQAHPLLQILQRLKKGDQLKEVPQPYPGSQIGPADFLLTVTGPVVLGTPNGNFVDVDVPVNVSRQSFTTGQGGGTKYYVGYVEFRTNPITDVSQLVDDEGLLDRTSISSGPTAPGSAAVANANDVSINFSDGVGTKYKFNRDGKIDFPAAQYGSSVSTMFVDYGFRFRPTWNGVGTGPELAVSWNDGIELTPITNDHFTNSNRATPFFIQGTYTSVAGKLPGNVYIDGGRNGPADVNGDVLIGSGYTKSTTIGQSNATIYIPGYAGQAADEAVQIRNVASANSVLQLFGRGEVQFITNTGASEKVFKFRDDAKLELPPGGDIIDSTGVSVLGGGGTANTGNITFTGDNIGSTTTIVTIEVDGGEGNREFTFGSDSRSDRAQLQMPQGAKINFGADATALGAPDNSGATDKIRLWDFQGSNPSGYNYAIGAEGNHIWFTIDVNNGTGGYKFYSQATEAFKIGDDGILYIHNTVKPVTDDSIDLGEEFNKFRNVYAAGVTKSHQRATTCPVNVDTVVYTATAQYQHAIKLFAMVEGNVDGEGTSWHTQACDIVAVRGYNNNTVFVTTYGVTYTSTAAFATFDGQWNATTGRIEITCRPVSTNNNVVVSIHATEITSQD